MIIATNDNVNAVAETLAGQDYIRYSAIDKSHGLVRILSDTSPMQMAAEQPLLGLLWVCLGVAPALPLAATPLAMWSNRHR